MGSDICCNLRINSTYKFVPHVHFILVDSVLSSVAFESGAAPAHSNYGSSPLIYKLQTRPVPKKCKISKRKTYDTRMFGTGMAVNA